VESGPGHWGAFFAVGTELLQGVVDAVEEDFVVDVLALRQKILIYSIFQQLILINFLKVKAAIWVLGILYFTRFFAAFF
jgi:hypothetical protein